MTIPAARHRTGGATSQRRVRHQPEPGPCCRVGEADVKVAGDWRRLTAADGPVLVGRDVRHELRNRGDAQAHLRTEVTPAGRLEEFLTGSAQAARAGLYNARNLPTGLRGAAWLSEFALRFSDETAMCSPPPALQRVVLPVAARLTRRWRP